MLDDMSDGVAQMVEAKFRGSLDFKRAAEGTEWEPLIYKDFFVMNKFGKKQKIRLPNQYEILPTV
jgi:hypothetical protein